MRSSLTHLTQVIRYNLNYVFITFKLIILTKKMATFTYTSFILEGWKFYVNMIEMSY